MRVRFVRPDGSIVTRRMGTETVPNPGAGIEIEGAGYTVERLILRQGNRNEALVVLADGRPAQSPKRRPRGTKPR